MKYVEFDRARFDSGEMPTHTRNGHRVNWVLEADPSVITDHPIIAWVEGFSRPFSFTEAGKVHASMCNEFDLVYEVREKVVRVVLYKSGTGIDAYFKRESVTEENFVKTINDLMAQGKFVDLLEYKLTF